MKNSRVIVLLLSSVKNNFVVFASLDVKDETMMMIGNRFQGLWNLVSSTRRVPQNTQKCDKIKKRPCPKDLPNHPKPPEDMIEECFGMPWHGWAGCGALQLLLTETQQSGCHAVKAKNRKMAKMKFLTLCKSCPNPAKNDSKCVVGMFWDVLANFSMLRGPTPGPHGSL